MWDEVADFCGVPRRCVCGNVGTRTAIFRTDAAECRTSRDVPFVERRVICSGDKRPVPCLVYPAGQFMTAFIV